MNAHQEAWSKIHVTLATTELTQLNFPVTHMHSGIDVHIPSLLEAMRPPYVR